MQPYWLTARKVERAKCELRTQMGFPCSKSYSKVAGAYMELLSAVSFPSCGGIVPLRLLESRYLRGVERRQR